MIRPYVTSYALLQRFSNYVSYSQGSSTYAHATDGVVSGTTLTSDSIDFTSAHVGAAVCVAGKGYAVIASVSLEGEETTTDTVTLDAAVGDGDALTVCVGGGTAQERDAFALMKVHMVEGYSAIIDGKLKPLVVGLRELSGKFGTTSEDDPDFYELVPDASHLFDEAHRWCCLYQLFSDQALQGGERWKTTAAEYFDRYLSHLSAAVNTFLRQLLESGDLTAVQDTRGMQFIPLERV